MPTLRAAITLYDGVSAPLKQMNRAIGTTLDSFEALSAATASAVDTASIDRARSAWEDTAAALAQAEAGVRGARSAQSDWNSALSAGTAGAGALLKTVKRLAVAAGGLAAVKQVLSVSDTLSSTRARLSLIADDGSVEELEQKIMASAQRSRASYFDTASAIASMGANAGAAFNGNDELIAFMEQVNKQFVIGGATAQGQSAAMLQLTQAMSAGALRGEELNSILENAPGIARAIERYLGVAEGSIKKYAEQGQITAEVVKNALFASAEETNEKFESMPKTWAQLWTDFSNGALSLLSPLLTRLNELANSDTLQTALSGATAAVAALARVGGWVLEGVVEALAAVTEGVSALAPMAATALENICGAVAVGGTALYNLTVVALNGVVQLLWSIVDPCLGVVEWILNVCNGGFDSFGGAVANLVGNIIGWFLSLGEVVTKIIDTIFGTSWTEGLEELKGRVTAWGKNENAVTLDRTAPQVLEYADYGAAWDSGVTAGAELAAAVGGLFDTTALDGLGAFTLGETLEGIYQSTADTALSTAATANALECTEEDLKYLRDLAEREVINRFTTAEVKVDMRGMTNKIDSELDIDGIFEQFGERFAEAVNTSCEGVYF